MAWRSSGHQTYYQGTPDFDPFETVSIIVNGMEIIPLIYRGWNQTEVQSVRNTTEIVNYYGYLQYTAII